MRVQQQVMIGFAILLFSAHAMAVSISISLTPSEMIVSAGDDFTIDLFMDATDAPGTHPGLFSGQLTIDYDPAQLTLNSFTALSPAVVSSETVDTSGSRTTVTYLFDDIYFDNTDPDQGIIGSFSFTALSVTQDAAYIIDANSLGSWVNQNPSNIDFAPNFTGTSITVVPLPGALWLMLSGLGLLGLARRRL